MAYPHNITLLNPRLGLHMPNGANGESLAKKSAVLNKTAKMVQNLFSNSCASWTPCDSLKRNRESV